MRDDEKQYFSGTWKELSHRQYRLEDEKTVFLKYCLFKINQLCWKIRKVRRLAD